MTRVYPDQGGYEERYRLSRTARAGVSVSLTLLGLAIVFLISGPLPGAVAFFALTAIALLPAVIGPVTRRIAFRADHAGITLGADPHDSWPLRPGRAAFIPWADVEQIVLYPQPGGPSRSLAWRIGIQRRPGAPELRAGDQTAPGCPLPRVTTAATRPVSGWRLDRDRLAAVTAAVAPGIPVVDAGTSANPSIEGPAAGSSL
jgi:hypothetical protein